MGPTPNPGCSHLEILDLITWAKTLSPNKVTFTGPRVRTQTARGPLFEGDTFQDAPWMPKSASSAEPCRCCFSLHTGTSDGVAYTLGTVRWAAITSHEGEGVTVAVTVMGMGLSLKRLMYWTHPSSRDGGRRHGGSVRRGSGKNRAGAATQSRLPLAF